MENLQLHYKKKHYKTNSTSLAKRSFFHGTPFSYMILTWSLNPVCLFREIMCCWLFLLIPAAKFFRFIWVSFCETWKIAILCHILFKKIFHLIHLILHLIWAYWIFGTSYADILVFCLFWKLQFVLHCHKFQEKNIH